MRSAKVLSLPDAVSFPSFRQSRSRFLLPFIDLRSLWFKDKYHLKKVHLPPLIETNEKRYDSYRLIFLSDGYPGKWQNGERVPHPLYGAYIINDYLQQYEMTKDKELLLAAIRVAKASIHRMEEYHGSLVFWYDPAYRLTSMPARFYSALTQSRYLFMFARLHQLTNDPLFLESAQKVLNSFFIDQKRGGVLKRFHGGTSLEEYPNDIPLYTLNGWLSATINLKRFADLSQSEEADVLFRKSADSIEKIIDLYDLEELANTRYNLSGYIPVQLKFSQEFKPKIVNAKISIPSEGDFPIRFQRTRCLWENFIKDPDNFNAKSYQVTDEIVELHAVLSMISFPHENSLSLEFETSIYGTVEVWIGEGDYNLFSSALIPTRWTCLGTFRVSPESPKVRIPISWNQANLVAYPTNFSKKLAGKLYNTYHYIHIFTLEKLYEYTGKEKFRWYAEKWLNYTKKWREMEPYKSARVELGPKRERLIAS
jgi:hypothetical protein